MKAAIEFRKVWYWYEDSIPALRDVNFAVEEGDWVAIVGQNGSGKTTLAKHCNGLLKPKRGRVLIYGEDTNERRVEELARTVGYVFQNPDHQIFCPTTLEEVSFGLRNLGFSREEIEGRAWEALRAFGLEGYASKPPAILGYGLRRKVAVAAVYAMRPRIMILDEPDLGLDWGATKRLLENLNRLHEEGHTIVLITHNMKIAAGFSQKVLVLHDGEVLTYGPTRGVFKEIELLEEAALSPPQITRLSRRMIPCGMRGDSLTVEEFCEEYSRLVVRAKRASSLPR